MALLCSVACELALLRMCFYVFFYVFLLSFFTRVTSAMIIYDWTIVLRMDRTAEAGITKGGGVCFMINKK